MLSLLDLCEIIRDDSDEEDGEDITKYLKLRMISALSNTIKN
jgi:hypothetical protein